MNVVSVLVNYLLNIKNVIASMFNSKNDTVVTAGYAIIFMAISAGIAVGLGMYIFLRNRQITFKVRQKKEQKQKKKRSGMVESWMLKRKSGLFSFEQIDRMQISTGERFRAAQKGDECTPITYLKECITFAVLFSFVFPAVVYAIQGKLSIICLLVAPVGAFVGIRIPMWSMTSNDESDNKKMLYDVNTMYETLKVTTRAGIPMRDGLVECYRQVKNARLKNALLDVTNAIRGNRSVENSLLYMADQFTSQEIQMFIIVVRQGLETGRSVDLLDDLSSNMREVAKQIDAMTEEDLKTKTQLVQIILLCILIFSMLMAVMDTLSTQMGEMMNA